jgi:hypothetical protein
MALTVDSRPTSFPESLPTNYVLLNIRNHEIIFDPDDSPSRLATRPTVQDIDLAIDSLADENPAVILHSLQLLIDAGGDFPFDVALPALCRLRDLTKEFIRVSPGIVERSWALLVVLSGFPCLSEQIVAGGLLDFFIDNIPWEPAIQACARLARTCNLARDTVIGRRGLAQVLEASESLAPDFGVLCDFARGLASYELSDASHVAALIARLVESESIQPHPNLRFMTMMIKVAENLPDIDADVLEVIDCRFATKDIEWHIQCAKYLLFLVSRTSRYVPLDRVWELVVRMMRQFRYKEELMLLCTETLIALVGLDVELFLGRASTVTGWVEDVSYAVKCNLVACVAAAFTECDEGQFVRLVDAGLGRVMVANLPEAGIGHLYLLVILHGVAEYVRKMEVLLNCWELSGEQFLGNPEFGRWMEEMGDCMAVRGDELALEWEALAALIASLSEGK